MPNILLHSTHIKDNNGNLSPKQNFLKIIPEKESIIDHIKK